MEVVGLPLTIHCHSLCNHDGVWSSCRPRASILVDSLAWENPDMPPVAHSFFNVPSHSVPPWSASGRRVLDRPHNHVS